ncbi:PREDICTED: uncharacterized protein LOC105561232 isoform X2 [Vollenhovia emeryi]|uniref:uncharacterized protein LOC105561232 isoform X2 n=1 Tax=Vollenhovia emeryi TaxID=411798 RepID=UPI0005F3A86D|nr:PREDICTED: uncharacterized protein LOC105561232 isoform X2 [Vollenhovia emeryi]
MTRCVRRGVNLKSSAYNQTGQNYYEQLAAYNSMNSHLRRILLARSVVDTRNKNYLKGNQRYKVPRADDSGIRLRLEATNDVIDKLAYDTQHHPMDILRIDLNAKHPDCCNYNLDHQLRVCSSQTSYEGTDQMDRRQRSTSKNQRMMSPMTARSPKRKKLSNCIYKKVSKSARDIPHIVGPSTCFARQRQFSARKEEDKKYVKFVYDITKEIMQRGLYTDKELQDVFKKHVNQYRGILNMV